MQTPEASQVEQKVDVAVLQQRVWQSFVLHSELEEQVEPPLSIWQFPLTTE